MNLTNTQLKKIIKMMNTGKRLSHLSGLYFSDEHTILTDGFCMWRFEPHQFLRGRVLLHHLKTGKISFDDVINIDDYDFKEPYKKVLSGYKLMVEQREESKLLGNISSDLAAELLKVPTPSLWTVGDDSMLYGNYVSGYDGRCIRPFDLAFKTKLSSPGVEKSRIGLNYRIEALHMAAIAQPNKNRCIAIYQPIKVKSIVIESDDYVLFSMPIDNDYKIVEL